MPEKIQDGHKKLGRWILAPVADITTTERGKGHGANSLHWTRRRLLQNTRAGFERRCTVSLVACKRF